VGTLQVAKPTLTGLPLDPQRGPVQNRSSECVLCSPSSRLRNTVTKSPKYERMGHKSSLKSEVLDAKVSEVR